MDMNGSDPVEVITRPGPDSIADVAVDEVGGRVYFSYGQSSRNDTETVQRANRDGTGLETIATYTAPGALTPRGIALDVAAGHVYWVAAGGCTPCPACGPCSSVQRADLGGSNPTTIWTLTGTHAPAALALNPESHLLYWADIQNAPQIQSVSSAGVNVQPVYTKALGTAGGVADVEVDLANGKLYWLERGDIGAQVAVRRASLSGSAVENLLNAGGTQATTPRGLAVDPVEGKLYWTESGFCSDPVSGRILRANLDGSVLEVVRAGLGVLSAIEVVRPP
jgi:DNA-binding beta-propeller fold protein YncE